MPIGNYDRVCYLFGHTGPTNATTNSHQVISVKIGIKEGEINVILHVFMRLTSLDPIPGVASLLHLSGRNFHCTTPGSPFQSHEGP